MAKRVLAICLCIAMAAALLLVPAAAEKTVLLGDLNGDGQRTAIDYMALKRHILGTYVLSETAKAAADLDGDGYVSARDYMILKRVILGTYMLSEQPEEPGSKDPSEPLMAAVTVSFLLKNGSEEELLRLESELGIELQSLQSMIIRYLASLSISEEEILAWESQIEFRLDDPAAIEAYLSSVSEQITLWLLSLLTGGK